MGEDLKDKWKRLSKEAALEKSEEAFRATEAELLAAYDDSSPSAADDRSNKIDKELKDEWQHLKRVAMAQFPEGSRILGLSPKNRLVAVATCLGWSTRKIAQASGMHHSTIGEWIRRPDIKLFIEEFNLRNGAGNRDILKEKLSELEYKAISCIEDIMADKDSSDGAKRLKLDASKWVFAVTRDKTEDSAAGIRTLIETLGRIAKQPFSLSPEEEKDIFESKVN